MLVSFEPQLVQDITASIPQGFGSVKVIQLQQATSTIVI